MIELVLDFLSLQSYLALKPTKLLADRLGVELKLVPLNTTPATRPPPISDEEESISQLHQRVKAEYSRMDAERYAKVQNLLITRTEVDLDSSIALCGLLAANARGCGFEYAEEIFTSYWSNDLDIQSTEAISEVLRTHGVLEFETRSLRVKLATIRETCAERHIFQTPFYWVDGERYQSRQHLPMIERQLTGRLP